MLWAIILIKAHFTFYFYFFIFFKFHARPREHGDAGPAEGRSDRPHRACAEAALRAPPTPRLSFYILIIGKKRTDLDSILKASSNQKKHGHL